MRSNLRGRAQSLTKVLHIIAGNLYGGIETILVSLARHRHLCPEMEPEFALCFEGRLADELCTENVPVHILGPVRFSRPWTIWCARSNLLQVLREKKIGAAICHAAWAHAVFAPTIRKSPTKLLFWLHTRADGTHWTERLAGKTPPDLAIAVSRDSGAHMGRTFPGLAYEVLYTPMPKVVREPDLAEKQQLRAQFGVEPGAVVITQASRMEDWKGHRIHLAALAEIKNDPHWRAWFVGGAQRPEEEKYLGELTALAKKLGITERVKFWGQRADVQNLLYASDIYCQPNLASEGFSIVFIEACLARLPILTSAIGGAFEIVDETSGVLTQPGDVPAVASGLRSLIADETLRKRLGDQAYRKVWSLCDPKIQLEKIHTLIENLAKIQTQ